ncbi:bacteriophage T5/ORF172 and tetratricopeptide domains-containing protein [Desulfonema limicola]|uniref:Bacteriophage T5/ORF172 and tetratricopeptide domains-containing protein n=1 Tax=Desulfonema limicola TaxID=45656 RepID=A0A975B3R5_9BACT|nr:GIY-YIG nuclease family protein [Desulfonema limicola]QTA78245.1 bacteriophage T5/ORF172 and tetratricopeptide domains-containing protein [Desulfonema limicola]
MNKGYLYILINPALPEKLIKIGKSTSVPPRVNPSSLTSDIPHIVYDIQVQDCDKAEMLVNKQLKKYRHKKYQDFYNLPVDKAVQIIKESAEQLDKLEYYKKAIELDPNNSAFYNNLGCIYDRLNNSTAAINAYKKAIELDPGNAILFNNLGCNYGKLGLYRKAIDSFKESIQINPDFIKSYFDLGFSYGQLGVHKEAVKAFKIAIKINPNIAQLHYNLGYSYNKLNLHKEAINAFNNAVNVNPKYINAHYSLGIKYLNTDDKENALKKYKDLKKLDKHKAKELFNLIYKQYRK